MTERQRSTVMDGFRIGCGLFLFQIFVGLVILAVWVALAAWAAENGAHVPTPAEVFSDD